MVLRFPDVINFRRQHRQSLCVMCGRSGDDPAVTIPSQNKDVCRDCDVSYWLLLRHSVMIKFCKGCKNFVTLAEFAEKPEASKCGRCRQRGRDNYFSRKKNSGGSAGGKRGDGNSHGDNNYGGAPGSGSKRKKGNDGADDGAGGGGGNSDVYTSINLYNMHLDTNHSIHHCYNHSQSSNSRSSNGGRSNNLSTPSMSLPPRAQAPNASTKALAIGTPTDKIHGGQVSTSRKGRRRVAPVFFDETEYSNPSHSYSSSGSKSKSSKSRGKNMKNDEFNFQRSKSSYINGHVDMHSYHMMDTAQNTNHLRNSKFGFNLSNSKESSYHNRASPRSVSFMGSLTPLSMSSDVSSGYVSGSSTSGMSNHGNEVVLCASSSSGSSGASGTFFGRGSNCERSESPFAGMEVPGGDRGRWQWDPSNPLMHLANLCSIMKDDDDDVSDEDKNDLNSPVKIVQLQSLTANEVTEVNKKLEFKAKLPPLPVESNTNFNSRNSHETDFLVTEGLRLNRSMSMSSVTSSGSSTGSSSGNTSVNTSPDAADSSTDVANTRIDISSEINPEEMEISLTPESPSSEAVDSNVGSPHHVSNKATINPYDNDEDGKENKVNIDTSTLSSGTTSATTSAHSSPTKVMPLTSTIGQVVNLIT